MKLLLTNVVWDNTYKETRFFSNVTVRNEWFGLPDSLDDRPNVNFNVRGDLLASCVINIGGSNLVRMNYNYLVVHDKTNNEYLFYFINSCNYLNGGQIQYNLELDVLTTYLPTISALPTFINKAHVDRFIKTTIDGNTVAQYNFNSENAIWLDDITYLAKRLVHKEPIRWRYTRNVAYNSDEIDEWLNDNVKYWLYIFISKNTYDRGKGIYDTNAVPEYTPAGVLYGSSTGRLNSPYGIFAIPIYRYNAKSMRISLSNYSTDNGIIMDLLNIDAFERWQELNNDNAYIYSYSLNLMPPIEIFSSYEWTVNDDGDLVTVKQFTAEDETSTWNPILYIGYTGTSGSNKRGYYIIAPNFIETDPIESFSINLTDYYLNTFDISQLKQANNNNLYIEPKLKKMQCTELQLSSSFADAFVFDGLKLLGSATEISFMLYAPVILGVGTYFVRPNFTDNGLYNEAYNEAIVGLVTTFDTTLPFAVSQIDTFLANNKNFFMQKIIGLGGSLVSGAISNATNFIGSLGEAFGGGLNNNVGRLVGGAISSHAHYLGSSANLGIETLVNGVNTYLTVDNMRNAPDTYKGTTSATILNTSILPEGIAYYIQIWDALDIDKKAILSHINKYGYSLGIEGNLCDYFHTRKYFNYVRGDIHSISNNLSNVVKNKIKSIFSNGIRLFHRDNFEDPVTQNYELSLED